MSTAPLILTCEAFRDKYLLGRRADIRLVCTLRGSGIPVAEVLNTYVSEAPEILPLIDYTARNQPQRLRNVRGRPPETFHGGASHLEPRQEELFFCEAYEFPEKEEPDAEEAPAEPIPYGISIRTSFASLEDKQIVHDVLWSLMGESGHFDPPLQPRTAARFLPGMTAARIGYEFFRPTFFGSLAGLAPEIFARFYLELSGDQIAFTAQENSLPLTGALPLESHLTALQYSLERAQLFPGLKEKLRQELKK